MPFVAVALEFLGEVALDALIASVTAATVDEVQHQANKTDAEKRRDAKAHQKHPFKSRYVQAEEAGHRIIEDTVTGFPEAFAETLLTAGILRAARVRRIRVRQAERAKGVPRVRKPGRVRIAVQNRRISKAIGTGAFLWNSRHEGLGKATLVGAVEQVAGSDHWKHRMKG